MIERWKSVPVPEKQARYGYGNFMEHESGEWVLFTGVVMFGYRVYLARKDMIDSCFERDWCGGEAIQATLLFRSILTVYNQDKTVEEISKEMPNMRIKPYFNDEEFVCRLNELMEGKEEFNLDVIETTNNLLISRKINMGELLSESKKPHPWHEGVEVDGIGNIFKDGEQLRLRPLKDRGIYVVRFNKSYYSAGKIVMETRCELPDPDKRWYVRYKDGDSKNVHPDNLYWSSEYMKRKVRARAGAKRSVLSDEEAQEIYNILKTEGGETTKRELAARYGVSEMTILRAYRRIDILNV
jgi:hypothetical protein